MPTETLLSSIPYHELIHELDARQRERGPVAGTPLPAPSLETRAALARIDEDELIAAARRARFLAPLAEIYGRDNRRDIYELARLVRASECVAAFVTRDSLIRSGDHYNLSTRPYGIGQELCPCERFYSQRTAAFGTGFLVAPDLLATAGHLADSSRLWNDAGEPITAFVFGFEMLDSQRARTEFPTQLVCFPNKLKASGNDWALVELDRKVDRPIAQLRRSGKVEDRTPLYMFGFPRGLPMKFVDDAWVHENCNRDHFKANLDAYSCDSGAPVFNAYDGIVEGIAVSGMENGEFKYLTKKKCRVSLRYPNSAADERCIRATELQPL